MATLTTEWANYGGGTWSSSGGSTVYFWIDAKYNAQDITNNKTTIEVRLTSSADHPNGNGGSGYAFSCTYCPDVSGNSVWYYANEVITQSGAVSITHDEDGTKSVTINGRAYNRYLGFDKYFSATFDLPPIPRKATIVSAPSFTDEENPVLEYSNPAGTVATTLQACLSFDGSAADIAYRDISKTGTSYTFNLTSAEKQVLYNKTTTEKTKPITFIIKTIIGETTYYTKLEKTLTIVNANPTGLLSFVETNNSVINYLGESTASTVIQGVSNIKATLTSSAKKGASIKTVNMTCGVASSGNASTYTFNGVSANSINYTITDSRGNTTTGVTPFENFVPYITPKIANVRFERISLDSNNIKLNAVINCYTQEIKDNINTFTITYSGTNGKTGTVSSYVKDTNKITITDLVLANMVSNGSETPTFTLKVKDIFSEVTGSDIVISIVPTFEAGENEFQINGDLFLASTTGENPINIKDMISSVVICRWDTK